jgi:hypothetical protein
MFFEKPEPKLSTYGGTGRGLLSFYIGEKWKWNYLNPFYHFQNFMQWVNDKTPRLRQNMINAV